MLEAGIIESSTSDWCAPGEEGWHFVAMCGLQRLNAVSESDAYPMPRVDDLIDRLEGAGYITKMDLMSGYCQVPVSPDAKHKTAFAISSGLFHFTRMPFGLKGAPATFQRLVDRVLQGLEEISGAYIDDIIVFSKSWANSCRMDRLKDTNARLTRWSLLLQSYDFIVASIAEAQRMETRMDCRGNPGVKKQQMALLLKKGGRM